MKRRSSIVDVALERTRKLQKWMGFTIERDLSNRCCPLCCKLSVEDEVRLTVTILFFALAVIALAFFVADFALHDVTLAEIYNLYAHQAAVIISGIFSFLATWLSWRLIQGHKAHYVHPSSQKHVIDILWMVPVYAVSAWLSLIFVHISSYIDFVRGVYEAYVIYSFMLLLTKYLGGHRGVVAMLKSKRDTKQTWPSPLCCLPLTRPDSKFLWHLKYGALQYVILSPIVSVLVIGLEVFDLYNDGEIEWDRGYVYCAFVQNATQLVSLYALVWLYILMQNELAPFKPMAKFLVVKMVVFFTFWQSVFLAVLVKMSYIPSTDNFSVGGERLRG
jgi:hypothetical protein